MKHSREKCAEAGREVRRIQREYLREVAGELTRKLSEVAELRRKWRSQDDSETIDSIDYMDGLDALEIDTALEKARRLGL